MALYPSVVTYIDEERQAFQCQLSVTVVDLFIVNRVSYEKYLRRFHPCPTTSSSGSREEPPPEPELLHP